MANLLGYYPRPYRAGVDKTTQQYHVENAKWAISEGMGEEYQDFLERARRNKRFYRGAQWEQEEDIESFLKDETGEERNRIQIVQNVIRPLVEQYRGNVSEMSMNAKVRSVSPRATDRREEALQEQLFMTELANEVSPVFREHLKETMNVGDTKEETRETFKNTWVDEYEKAMERLTNYVRDLNDLDDHLYHAGFEMITTGLGVMIPYQHGGHTRFTSIESERYIPDRSARKSDHSDSSFWGYWDLSDPSTLYEYYNLEPEAVKYLERHIENVTNYSEGSYEPFFLGDETASNGRPTVYTMYWRDFDEFYMGYVEDAYGYPMLVRIGEDEDDSGNVYTESDLIDPPDTKEDREIFGDKMAVKRVLDVIRYCELVLVEELIAAEPDQRKRESLSEYGDIVLDHGILERPEPNIYDQQELVPPIKIRAWSLSNGYIMSPVDDVIDPQRMINRILSVAESQINNSGGAGMIYDKDATDPDEEDEIMRGMDRGGPIGLSTRGRGVPNSIQPYDNTPQQGTYGLYQLVQNYQQFVQETTGVNRPMQGQQQGEDQLVEVTRLMIQKGSLIQQPFYYAISKLMLQCFQYIITVGKDYYVDNNPQLAMAVGDSSAEVLSLTQDMKHEYFAAYVEKEASDEVLKQSANQLIQFLLQGQMIDQEFFSKHYNASTPDQVMRSLREHTGEKVEQQKKQQKRQQQAMQQMAQEEEMMQQSEQARQEAREEKKEKEQQLHELEKEVVKKQGEAMVEESKNT